MDELKRRGKGQPACPRELVAEARVGARSSRGQCLERGTDPGKRQASSIATSWAALSSSEREDRCSARRLRWKALLLASIEVSRAILKSSSARHGQDLINGERWTIAPIELS